MNPPNAEQAIIDLEKLEGYCLNPDHARGKHKARVFAAALGFGPRDAEGLKAAIAKGVLDAQCWPGEVDKFGRRYTADLEITRGGRAAVVRTSWIIRSGETEPRLTTCYVKA